jgi:hypothetical protein
MLSRTIKVFSTLVLSKLQTKIDTALQNFILDNHQQPNDDVNGPIPHTASLIDDISIINTYSNLPYSIHHSQGFGKPLGISLNLHITQILTSRTTSNGQQPLTHLSSHDRFHLQSTMDHLKKSSESQTSSKITTRAHFLGFPIGSATFAANEYIAKLFFDPLQ